ncbi:hypothetical protein AAF712_012361 [Marasmius tenuissimus]|uniref:LysM domain-containing protein n=1 Tax=Marasmius tenuissimus TaxID=585030 RepID=A0ABR2ZK34_9AGAR
MPFLYLTLFSFVVVAQALAPRGPACTQQYTVQPGDSCNAIEKNFKLTSGTVRSLNSLVNPQCTNLYPGQSLCLSTSSSGSSGGGGGGGGGGASCSQAYTVQSGDTCSKIEKNFGLSAGSVIEFNSAVNSQCTNMYPGQSLCLVAGGSTGGSGGGGSTITVTSAGPVQTATALVTLTQTYTLSASTETETKTLSPTTVTTTITATVPVSVTATETSLVTTTATVTAPTVTVTEITTQSTTVTVTSTATPSASCPSVSRFVCAAKDKVGTDLWYQYEGVSATLTQCIYYSAGSLQGYCLYKASISRLIFLSIADFFSHAESRWGIDYRSGQGELSGKHGIGVCIPVDDYRPLFMYPMHPRLEMRVT